MVLRECESDLHIWTALNRAMAGGTTPLGNDQTRPSSWGNVLVFAFELGTVDERISVLRRGMSRLVPKRVRTLVRSWWEFLVLLCPLEYPVVHLHPHSIGDRGSTRRNGLFRGALTGFDSLRLLARGTPPLASSAQEVAAPRRIRGVEIREEWGTWRRRLAPRLDE